MSSQYLAPILAYVIVANPATYKLTAGILGSWIANSEGTAKLGGLVLHAIVFLFLASLLASLLPKKAGFTSRPAGAAALPDLEGSPLVRISGVTNA